MNFRENFIFIILATSVLSLVASGVESLDVFAAGPSKKVFVSATDTSGNPIKLAICQGTPDIGPSDIATAKGSGVVHLNFDKNAQTLIFLSCTTATGVMFNSAGMTWNLATHGPTKITIVIR